MPQLGNVRLPLGFLLLAASHVLAPGAFAACPDVGQWLISRPSGGAIATIVDVSRMTRDANYVLLGEAHDNPAHHLWQLQMLATLLAHGKGLIIGMEMFPRRVQPALDRWVEGKLTRDELLELTEWDKEWRFDPDLYLPILNFARLNRVPVVALNVDRALVSATSRSGWNAIDSTMREGITDPAPASPAYRKRLEESFALHTEITHSRFEYFVQAQLVWDRAFAQRLIDARAANPGKLVAGIIGSGHLQYGHGVPHQLLAMGEDHVRVLLPMDTPDDIESTCTDLQDIADAVFGTENVAGTPPMRLGVYLRDEQDETHVREIVPDSVAAAAGLEPGDRIVSAAGSIVQSSADLIAIVRKQAPGTWLPITIIRDGESKQLVGRFPPHQERVAKPDANSDGLEKE